MKMLLCFTTILAGCSPSAITSLAFFSTPHTKPLIEVEEIVDQSDSTFSKQTAHVIHSQVIDRLNQKNHVLITDKPSQFSVKMELVKHLKHKDSSNEVEMLVYLEILDLREDKSKTILKEVLCSNALVKNSSFIEIDWNKPTFRISPLGLAHKKLSREIASRIEDYILPAKQGKTS